MLTEQQKKLLLGYRDKSYIMSLLCSECSDFYNLINNIFKFPLIISSSIMTIFNSSSNSANMQTANIILNVSTTLILSLVSNFKLNERVVNFTNGRIKFNKLTHVIEDRLFNEIDDITSDDIRNIINDYDMINDLVEFPYVSHIKKKLIKKFTGIKTMPNTLNCVSDVVINNSDIVIN